MAQTPQDDALLAVNCRVRMQQSGANFGFLAEYDPQLVHLAQRAEYNFAEDPNTCLVKLRQFGELLIRHVAARFAIPAQATFADTIHRLRREGVLPDVIRGFDELRHAGNEAVHGFTGDHAEALHKLKIARGMAVWFHRIHGNPKFSPGPSCRRPTRSTSRPSCALSCCNCGKSGRRRCRRKNWPSTWPKRKFSIG